MSAYQPPPDGTYHPRPLDAPDGVERRATSRTRYVHGEQRVAGWLDGPIESALSCPRGHHVRDGLLVVDNQALRCQHRDRQGSPPCGLLVWVIVDTRSRAVFAAEVDWEDVCMIKTHRDVHETLRYLGAPIWPSPAQGSPRIG